LNIHEHIRRIYSADRICAVTCCCASSSDWHSDTSNLRSVPHVACSRTARGLPEHLQSLCGFQVSAGHSWKALHCMSCVTHPLSERVTERRLIQGRSQMLKQRSVGDGRRNNCVELVWGWGRRGDRSSWRKTCLSATLSTTNSIHTQLWPNLGLPGESVRSWRSVFTRAEGHCTKRMCHPVPSSCQARKETVAWTLSETWR